MTKRNLYDTLSIKKPNYEIKDIMNFIQYADGKNDLNQITEITGLSLNKSKKY